MTQLIVIVHAFTTLAMTGLIWFVQIVHYPLMRLVHPAQFVDYERRHVRRATVVVAPLMLVELAAAALLVVTAAAGPTVALAGAGAGLLLIVWMSTLMMQVPCHTQLRKAFDARVHARLVTTNWIRTSAWTARSIIACVVLAVT